MTEIEEIRRSIDLIDSQMAVLFESRMEEVAKIAVLKAAGNMPVTDVARESAIREKNSKLVRSDEFRPYFERFYNNVISLSKEYQRSRNEK